MKKFTWVDLLDLGLVLMLTALLVPNFSKLVGLGWVAFIVVSEVFFWKSKLGGQFFGKWLIRLFVLAAIGLMIGSQRTAMYAGIGAVIALLFLGIFFPKKETAEYQAREEEGAA